MHISSYIVRYIQVNGCSLMGQPAAIDTGIVSAHCRLSKILCGIATDGTAEGLLLKNYIHTTVCQNGYTTLFFTQNTILRPFLWPHRICCNTRAAAMLTFNVPHRSSQPDPAVHVQTAWLGAHKLVSRFTSSCFSAFDRCPWHIYLLFSPHPSCFGTARFYYRSKPLQNID